METVNDYLSSYSNTGVTFSSLETQGDILLKNNLDKSPEERLNFMNILNSYAFRVDLSEKLSFKNTHIIFSNYEYIP